MVSSEMPHKKMQLEVKSGDRDRATKNNNNKTMIVPIYSSDNFSESIKIQWRAFTTFTVSLCTTLS